VQESKGIIKALHLFDLHGNPSNYRHSQTIIVHNNGFRFIVLGVSDEVANRRTQTIMQRVENKRLERERAGEPFNFEDYLSISQMGLLASLIQLRIEIFIAYRFNQKSRPLKFGYFA
jgi:hypothetical protein